MEFLLFFLALATFGETTVTPDFARSGEVLLIESVGHDRERAPQGDISIVMDDMIALVETNDPTDAITAFRVYDSTGSQKLFEDNSCSTSTCNYDLSALSPGTYHAEVDSNQSQYRGPLTIQ